MAALDVTDASFESEVLELSDKVPVIIDLWAPWCGPCRTLGPIIESAVDATEGAVALAKVNIDENPRIASTFQVQSIPAVFAIHERKIVGNFIGALPEREVKEFIARFAPATSEADELVEPGDEDSLRKVLEEDPADEKAITALARLLVDRGDKAEALAFLERIPETAATRPIAARARLPRSDSPDGSWSPEAIDAKIADLLQLVPGDEDARQQIVDFIETLEPDDPRQAVHRRALASRLF
jgi:putative thioredoxin